MTPDDPEVQGFLADSMVVELATLSRKAVPSLTPIWFVCDHGRIYMGTGAATLAVRNISARAGVVLLFDAERRGKSDRILRITGHATVRRDTPTLRVLLRMAMKYFLSPGGMRSELAHFRKWGLRRRYYAQGKPAVIEVVPETAEFLPGIAASGG